MANVVVAMMMDLSGRKKAIILGSVMLGLFVTAVDQTVVSTATPRVVAELGGLSLYSWVFTAYMLTSTTLVPIVGKLGDMYGRKPFFMGGIAVFMVASVLSGASQTIEQLIVFRGLQGVGAGLIMANSFTIIGDLFPPSERGKFQGLFSAVFGLASITGPFIGGYLTDNLSWRWAFYVNIPIGLVALPALYLGLPKARRGGPERRIDYAGTVLLVLATVPLLLASVWVGEGRFALASPTALGMFAFSALMAALFVVVERRAQEPVLPVELFRNRTFAIVSVIVFVVGLAMFGVISFVPLFVQGALGRSATSSGAVTMPMMIAMVITSVIAGQLVSRTGRYKWQSVIGTCMVATGIFLLSRLTVRSSVFEVSRDIVIVGVGMGLSMAVFGLAAQNAVPHRLLGVATASNTFFRQMGGTLGVAVLGAMMTARLAGEVERTLPQEVRATAPPELVARAEDAQTMLNPTALAQLRAGFDALGGEGPRLFEAVLATMRAALAHALSGMFVAGAALILIAVVANLFLPETPLRRTVLSEGEAAPPPGGPEAAAPRPAGVQVEARPLRDA